MLLLGVVSVQRGSREKIICTGKKEKEKKKKRKPKQIKDDALLFLQMVLDLYKGTSKARRD